MPPAPALNGIGTIVNGAPPPIFARTRNAPLMPLGGAPVGRKSGAPRVPLRAPFPRTWTTTAVTGARPIVVTGIVLCVANQLPASSRNCEPTRLPVAEELVIDTGDVNANGWNFVDVVNVAESSGPARASLVQTQASIPAPRASGRSRERFVRRRSEPPTLGPAGAAPRASHGSQAGEPRA